MDTHKPDIIHTILYTPIADETTTTHILFSVVLHVRQILYRASYRITRDLGQDLRGYSVDINLPVGNLNEKKVTRKKRVPTVFE